MKTAIAAPDAPDPSLPDIERPKAREWVVELRAPCARLLERGALDGRAARLAASVWAALADPVRPLRLPPRLRVVGVGGATLGGSGKTPLVLAVAQRLGARTSVVVAASAYRARPVRARVVRPDDDVREVGDEALLLARALPGVPVLVAPSRADALEHAATLGDLCLVDGLLQTRPVRLACSLLVLDANAPWGSGRCPPAGDLRATKARLLAACDAVVSMGGSLPGSYAVDSELAGARTASGELVEIEALRSLRLGLMLAIARPERVLDSLGRVGIVPVVISFAADHGMPRLPRAAPPVDAWLMTRKCATKVGENLGNSPVWQLEQRLSLPGDLLDRVAGRAMVGSAACFSAALSPT